MVLVAITWSVGALATQFACFSISGGPWCVLSYIHTFWRLRRLSDPWVCGHTSCSPCALGFVVCVFVVAVVHSSVACGSLLSVSCGCPSYHASFRAGGLEYGEYRMHTWAVGCVSCLPRWTVCPTRSPSLGTNRSMCRGECSLSGTLVTPRGRCHFGPLTNGPGRMSPYCVCSARADTVTGGASKPLRLGPSPASPVGSFRPVPPLPLCWPRWWVPRGGGAGGAGSLATPG